MADKSSIQWTDATWNPTTGCTKVSPGCAHCYIERTPAFRIPGRKFVNGATDLRLHYDRLDQPLRWRKPRKVFVNSLSDLFHDDVPDTFILAVFAVMANASEHTFQVLTKRPSRMQAFVSRLRWKTALGFTEISGRPHLLVHLPCITGDEWEPTGSGPHKPIELARFIPPNVWLGTSVENQHFADERIPLLLQTPAAVRFISAEPLLGPVDLTRVEGGEWEMFDVLAGERYWKNKQQRERTRLDWVIVGGESGPGARPFEVAWARSMVKQCQDASVAVFVKQLGARVIDRNDAGFEGDTPRSWPMDTDVEDSPNGFREEYQGAPVRVRLRKKGGEPSEWPRDLRVRQFPEVRA